MEVLPLIKNLSMVDGHAHSLLKDFLSLKSPESFHSVFTESRQEKVISSSVPLSMSYRHMIRTLKETFNLEKGADYLEFRRGILHWPSHYEQHAGQLKQPPGSVCSAFDWDSFSSRLKAAVNDGTVTKATLDAVRRGAY